MLQSPKKNILFEIASRFVCTKRVMQHYCNDDENTDHANNIVQSISGHRICSIHGGPFILKLIIDHFLLQMYQQKLCKFGFDTSKEFAIKIKFFYGKMGRQKSPYFIALDNFGFMLRRYLYLFENINKSLKILICTVICNQ